MTTLRIGTRGSALALWQAEEVARHIRQLPSAPAVELVTIKTRGDLNTDTPLWAAGGKGFFTAELDRALLDNEVDLVVHSLKDLATEMPEGLSLAAVLEREDPRDALLTRDGRSFHELAKGAKIGTSSLRRRAFIARLRPDLEHLELRGNVPTRLRKLEEGGYDAIVLAVAGLKRLGVGAALTVPLTSDEFPPAVGQGAIAVAIRAGDAPTARWIAPLDHKPTRLSITAERALLARLEGGCQVPIGGLAAVTGNVVSLRAAACSLDGRDYVAADAAASTDQAAVLGAQVAEVLLAKGASRILDAAQQRRAAAISNP